MPQVEVRLAKAEPKNWPALDRGGEQAAVGVATEQKPPAPYAGWVQGRGWAGVVQHNCGVMQNLWCGVGWWVGEGATAQGAGQEKLRWFGAGVACLCACVRARHFGSESGLRALQGF